MQNPFRERRRAIQDRRDMIRAELRGEIEPVPDVVCTQCDADAIMEYQREYSTVQPEGPLIEASWQCPNCERMAYGYVGRDGLTPILDNARPAEED